jgi:hypothetical protein
MTKFSGVWTIGITSPFSIMTPPLEHTAESQEKNTEDADPKERPGSSHVPKKDKIERDFILVSSSGGPPEPSRHVSSCYVVLRVSSLSIPRG